MPYQTWITMSFPSPVIFRYHLPLKEPSSEPWEPWWIPNRSPGGFSQSISWITHYQSFGTLEGRNSWIKSPESWKKKYPSSGYCILKESLLKPLNILSVFETFQYHCLQCNGSHQTRHSRKPSRTDLLMCRRAVNSELFLSNKCCRKYMFCYPTC